MESHAEGQVRVAGGALVPLKAVEVRGTLLDSLATLDVVQRYRNDHDANVEIVYTFPMPVDAVLLGLEVRIGARRFEGRVSARREAEVDYENAVDDGDTALLLSQSASGVYSMSLGNLMAGEEAEVRLRYAQLLGWSGDSLRFRLPTTIAPRYGDAQAAGLAPHEVPAFSLEVDYPLEVALELRGSLADATVESPTHAVVVDRGADRVRVGLARRGSLDRDLVIAISGVPAPVTAWVAADADRWCAWVAALLIAPHESGTPPAAPAGSLDAAAGGGTTAPAIGGVSAPRGRDGGGCTVRFVIDCSGSMRGDSIAQAKEGLVQMLDPLRESDRFNVTAFGSTHRSLFEHDVAASAEALEAARAWVRSLDADMGGTELADALVHVISRASEARATDLLVITDGEVWDAARPGNAARDAAVRIFAVGVGSAPAEGVLRELCDQSGGALELVVPGEEMAGRIVRHFARLRQPRCRAVALRPEANPQWSSGDGAQSPFEGDTVHRFAFGSGLAPRHASIDATWETGTSAQLLDLRTLEGELARDVFRMAVARRLPAVSADERRALALEWQLLSDQTAMIATLERAEGERAQRAPSLALVPQMVAAGWGGHSTVHAKTAAFVASAPCGPDVSLGAASAHPRLGSERLAARTTGAESLEATDSFDALGVVDAIEGWIDQLTDSEPRIAIARSSWARVVQALERLPPGTALGGLESLRNLGMPDALVDALAKLASAHAVGEEAVVMVFLRALRQSHRRRFTPAAAKAVEAWRGSAGAGKALFGELRKLGERIVL